VTKLLVVVLMTALSTSPLLAQAASSASQPAVIGQFVKGLAPGTLVKLKLASGAKVKGMLIAADDEAVTIRPKTRIPEPIRRISLDEIADAEVGGGTMAGRAVAIGAGIGAGAALGFVFLLVMLYGSD
jgi:hypothetical protein